MTSQRLVYATGQGRLKIDYSRGVASAIVERRFSLGRIARLEDDHYTAQLWLAARGAAPAHRFAELAALAARIGMHRFVRPFDAARFAEGVALAARHIRSA